MQCQFLAWHIQHIPLSRMEDLEWYDSHDNNHVIRIQIWTSSSIFKHPHHFTVLQRFIPFNQMSTTQAHRPSHTCLNPPSILFNKKRVSVPDPDSSSWGTPEGSARPSSSMRSVSIHYSAWRPTLEVKQVKAFLLLDSLPNDDPGFAIRSTCGSMRVSGRYWR